MPLYTFFPFKPAGIRASAAGGKAESTAPGAPAGGPEERIAPQQERAQTAPAEARRKRGCSGNGGAGPGTHASAAQLVALHQGDPGAQLGRPARAGQPARAAADHQVVVGPGAGRRALRLRLLPARHGAGHAAGNGGGARGAGEGARRPLPARPLAGVQGPGQQGHARKCAEGAALGPAPGKEGARAPGKGGLGVTKHLTGVRGGEGGCRAGRESPGRGSVTLG